MKPLTKFIGPLGMLLSVVGMLLTTKNSEQQMKETVKKEVEAQLKGNVEE